MKRIAGIMICLVLLGTLVLSVAAAGSAHMSISSSNGTVHRGDSFTLTVSLSNDQPVSNGGIVLSYDSSIFELVGGSCNVSNATLAEFSTANNGGVFILQTDAVVSGTIFTVNMKVKSNAAFGSYSISGTPSLNIDCGISGTSITVECQHSFGKSSKVDDSNHESTCSICGKTVKEAHTWDNGTVTKAATCKDTGTKVLKCTACAAEKTESIPVNEDHKYGSWSSQGSDGHSRTCSVCGNNATGDHTWYAGDVLEEATCQKTGVRSVYCADCGESAQETIPVADHSNVTINTTATQHTFQCSVCGNVTTGDHTYGEAWEHDKAEHYHSCESCGYKTDQAAHKPGPKATETTDQVCTVCDRVLQPKGEHVHEFAKEWTTDETSHWSECVDCPARSSEGTHAFTNDCDTDCNICGMTREVTHQLSLTINSDKTGHWYTCQLCGAKEHFAAHTPGPEATITAAQVCTVCQFEIAPMLPHDHDYDADGTLHYHKCICGDEYAADAETCEICAEAHRQFPWWILCIVEAVIFGAVIVFLFLKKCGPEPDDSPEEDPVIDEDPMQEEANTEESVDTETAPESEDRPKITLTIDEEDSNE